MQRNQCPIYNGTLELLSQYEKKVGDGGRVSFCRRDVSKNRVKGFILSFIPEECFKKC